MARLHTKKKGRSASKKPLESTSASWAPLSPNEVMELIVAMAKEGKTEAQIGQALRDQYGIASVLNLTGKSILQVLQDEKLAPIYPSDLMDLIRRATSMRNHLKANPRDTSNRIKLAHVESKIKRLVKYYRGKRLPEGWKYDPETAALLVK